MLTRVSAEPPPTGEVDGDQTFACPGGYGLVAHEWLREYDSRRDLPSRGVSKALFYFYFPRKEDVLFDVGVLSTQAAQRTVHQLLGKPYEVPAVVDAALTTLEHSMARNPPDLIIETILEGYRHEHRILAGEIPAYPA